MDLKLGEELNDRVLGTLQAAITPMVEFLTKRILECEHKLAVALDNLPNSER